MVTKHQNREVHKFASTHCILFANLKKLLAKKKFQMKLKVNKYQKSERAAREKNRMYMKLLKGHEQKKIEMYYLKRTLVQKEM